MPHYRDGTEAHVGDQVYGRLSGSGPEPRAGTVISITPEAESCNAVVQFTEAARWTGTLPGASAPDTPPAAPRTVVTLAPGDQATPGRTVLSEVGGTRGDLYELFTCVDYANTGDLTRVR